EEMLEVKVPFWKTWKFWGWFSGVSLVTIALVSYQLFVHHKMDTLSTQNAVLLEQNQLLNQEVVQTRLDLKKTKKEEQPTKELLNNTKKTSAAKAKINRETSDEKIVKERAYSSSKLAKGRSDISISERTVDKKDENASTFGGAIKMDEEPQEVDVRETHIQKPVQEIPAAAQREIDNKKPFNLIETKARTENNIRTNLSPLAPLNKVFKYHDLLLNSDTYQVTSLAEIRENYLRSMKVKLEKPLFTPSLRLGFTSSIFSSFSSISNSKNIAYNGGLVVQWQAFRNFGFTGGLRYTELSYSLALDDTNQEILEDYPNAERVNTLIKTINANHHYFDLPIGIIWKVPIGKKGSQLYANPNIAWQFYLPQTFEYETFDNDLIPAQHNNLYAYFGSATLNLGYEVRLQDNFRLQMGLWAEQSFVEYGIDNRSGINLGVSTTLVFGK
ncbi:MAG: hypothetical protein AAGG68_18735, partial [Bacteroidota bacterium]